MEKWFETDEFFECLEAYMISCYREIRDEKEMKPKFKGSKLERIIKTNCSKKKWVDAIEFRNLISNYRRKVHSISFDDIKDYIKNKEKTTL